MGWPLHATSGLDRETRLRWEGIVVVIALAAIVAVSSLLAWLAYLSFCRFLVTSTKDPASLRHAATAARAFRSAAPGGLAQVLAKLIALLRR